MASPKSVSLTCPVPSTRKFFQSVSQSTQHQARSSHLRLEITVDIPKFVELVHRREHFANIKPRVFLFQDPRVVEQCPEVTPRHVLHGEIDILRVLESVQ